MPLDVDRFITDGFLRIENAFARSVADGARAILWRDVGCDAEDRSTWTKPMVWLGEYGDEPFRLASNAPALTSAYDALVGEGRWLPSQTVGNTQVRFPPAEAAEDVGWHVDASFPGADSQSVFDWRINARSRGRALLLLFLFSDVGEDDAPTRLRVGSHLDVARRLHPAGEDGMSFRELAAALRELPAREEVLATGAAGTVYLCHPFLVHAPQPLRGTRPRFMAQPALLPRVELALDGPSPVEQAIRLALSSGP